MSFFWREALAEFRSGLRGGIVPLIYIGLVGYLLIWLTDAEYLRDMGAVDIPRNAPGLVYLMTSGASFFLFFAWAWVFAQAIVRDRSAQLHEVVLAAPIPLRRWLLARYVGALGVALVLGSSQVAGFLLAPGLEWIGALPAGSVGATPWLAFAWSALIFTLPLALGAGALYTVAAIHTRSVAGPFAVAAFLMLCWMVAMIVFKGNHADQAIATLLDPSGFAEAEYQVENWTPREKTTALLELTPALLANRLLWVLLPLALFAVVLARITREKLSLERAPRRRTKPAAGKPQAVPAPTRVALRPIDSRPRWGRAVAAEAAWQIKQTLNRRWFWLSIVLLVVLAVGGAFVHVVQHAYGPLVPRTELVTPLLTTMFYLIIAFVVAALAGVTLRRDHQPGFGEMFDATPAPAGARLVGAVAAVAAVTLVLALIPGLGAIVTAALAAPDSLSVLTPLLHQIAVLAPGLLELAAVSLLLHALIRRPGPAYAASILAAFIMIVNHETGLVPYPPYQIGLPVVVSLSGLAGLAPWLDKLLISNGFKLALVVLLIACAAMVMQRGTDSGWRLFVRRFRIRLFGPAGAIAATASLALVGFGALMQQRFVEYGNYESREQRIADYAQWEQAWLSTQAPFAVAGGSVDLVVRPQQRELRGHWRLEGVRTAGAFLHAGTPTGFRLGEVTVQGQPVAVRHANDHLAIPLPDCPAAGCNVELEWSLNATGWDTEGGHPWLLGNAYWLRAVDVMPRLGLDPDRILRVTADRARHGLSETVSLPAYPATPASGAVAPAGRWQWRVQIDGRHVREGETTGLLDFADAWAATAVASRIEGYRVLHDPQRTRTAQAVAQDLDAMAACVHRRLGAAVEIDTIAQWPRKLGDTTAAGRWLIVREDPHWDVDDHGTGRTVRRAAMATALARRIVQDSADLRQGSGAVLFSEGLPGAIGLLCAGEADGVPALAALMHRSTDRITEALAGSSVPVGALRDAHAGGWAAEYAPQAARDWAARQSPQQLQALLSQIRATGDVEGALAAAVGEPVATLLLGPPQATELRLDSAGLIAGGERWRWEAGGWSLVPESPEPGLYSVRDNQLVVQPAHSWNGTPSLAVDMWPSYEREPRNNVLAPGAGHVR
ncbi:ABC transporter permease [Alkalilimnicola ehrlichii]|uniref:ABC transporter permease n=1 Tax=Alkalilimnicola ehrlichii TaxID=351052 RepID=A0A3E0WRZ6_9GAMM|nr:ABC transporter permease [Alkalilimnicola ehrlichii]RFA28585.1 ABC transporter permease [Alkalilimnicola ehrlichii]RFA35750.1 ABC transporter permease [Alkalilimnicola ehrlichii]